MSIMAITLCMDNPIKTDISDWMANHKGRVSIGIQKDGHYEILAYSDQRSDRPELQRMAYTEKAKIINSVVSEGVMAVE